MSLATIRAGLKANLETVFTSYEVYSYEPKKPAPFAIVVGWPDVYDPRPVQGAGVDVVIPVRFEIPFQEDISTDDALESAMDAAVAALEVDRTLGGAADDCSVAGFTDIGARTMPDDTVIATFTAPVEVMY